MKGTLSAHGLELGREPRVTRIVGAGDEDPAQLDQLIRAHSPEPSLVTFSDVLDALIRDYDRHYGSEDRLLASGFFFVGWLLRLPAEDEQYLLDVGSSLDRNRVSLAVSPTDLSFVVRDRQGIAWTCSVPAFDVA